jgi:signal transduction histidine kinase
VRLATKTFLTLASLYLALVLGLGLWLHRWLAAMAHGVMESTAALVGREIAVATTETALGQLLDPDPETRMRMLTALHRMSRHSQVVRSIAAVGEQGEVLASDDFLDVGRSFPPAAEVFAAGREPRVVAAAAAAGGDDRWQVLVPLVRADLPVGYLRISLYSERLAAPHLGARRRLWWGALGGLLALGALGLALHLQVARRGREVALGLERALAGQSANPPRRDEFAPAFAAAQRVGQELQRARGQSAQAQQRLGALSQVMDVGALLVGRAGELEFANSRACELLGASGAEELQSAWPGLFAALRPALGPDTAPPPDAAGRRADLALEIGGSRRLLRCHVQPLVEGESEAFLVLLRDRAMLEALETDLCLATQLRALTHLYRALTHDLRAPLNSMVLNLELLRGTLAADAAGVAEVDEEAPSPQHYVDVLRQEFDRLNRSLQDLLAETSPAGQARQEFDLRDLALEIQRLLAPQARQQGVELALDLPADAVPMAGLRDRVKQAVLNVALNGLEAMPSGGRLALALRTEPGRAVLTVADTGPGIPPELVRRVFDMHFTTKTSGTGIGLYVARSVAEGHGGELEVETGVGRGTLFRFRLPLLLFGS